MFICISISRKTDWCPSVPLYLQCIEVSLEEKLKGSIAPMIEQNFQCFTGYADLGVLWQWLMKCTVDNATNAFGYHSKFHSPSSWNPRFPVYLFSLICFGKINFDTCRNLDPPSLVLDSQLNSQPSKTLDLLDFLRSHFYHKDMNCDII